MRTRNYRELSRLETFEDRFDYLVLPGQVGIATFGHNRWLNQMFYTSPEWRQVRNYVIVRDEGCDLGVEGYDITHGLLVHHMTPITVDDVRDREEWILDPEFLICTSQQTHNAIHYGDRDLLPRPGFARHPGDTCLW